MTLYSDDRVLCYKDITIATEAFCGKLLVTVNERFLIPGISAFPSVVMSHSHSTFRCIYI